MPIADLALFAAASLFALMGLAALLKPDAVSRQFGVPPLSPAGRNEVRAVYGGFGIAMAALLVWTFGAPELRAGVCVTLAVALFGMAAGRLVSALIDRRFDKAPLFYFAVEIAAGAALLLAS